MGNLFINTALCADVDAVQAEIREKNYFQNFLSNFAGEIIHMLILIFTSKNNIKQ